MNFLRHCGLRFGFLLLVARALAPAAEVPLQYARIDLLDGRTLKNVVVKSYDAASDRLLIVADGSALLVPVSLIPAPFGAHLKAGAPPAGSSTAVVATQIASPTAPAARPAVPADPVPGLLERERLRSAHRQTAEARALRYFRYEFPAGSNAISVTAVEIVTDRTEPIPGWPGRFRTKGTAHLEFYDSKGNSFSRGTIPFEALTEQKPGEPLHVVEFTRK